MCGRLVIFLLCSDMYMAAREYANAVDIMGENGWVDRSASTETTVDVCMSKYLLSFSWMLVFMKNEVFVLNMHTHLLCVQCRLLGLVHEVDKSQTEILIKCANYLKKLGQVGEESACLSVSQSVSLSSL